VVVRPLRRRDRADWIAVRNRNEAWLRPWEATRLGTATAEIPWEARHTPATYTELLRRQRQNTRTGTHLPFGIFVDRVFAGQVNLGEIVHGAFCSANIGYWIDEGLAGRGITPTAVALLADHAFRAVGLHRLEANIRPENSASLAVVRKLGFTDEGFHRRFLAIDGDWRDHRCFALLAEDHPGGVLGALLDRTVV
jgi:ribosomal-protein-alanine N-acetyltransferase